MILERELTMRATRPHYLLFTESESDSSSSWHFVLEAVDGSERIEAADDEIGLAEDRLELLAVVRGLEALPLPAKVTLTTCSRYVNRGLRFGLAEWRENDWQWERFGEWSPISNADLWQRLDHALQIHDVRCAIWRVDGAHRQQGPHLAPENQVGDQRGSQETGAEGFTRRAGRWMRGWLKQGPVRAAQLL